MRKLLGLVAVMAAVLISPVADAGPITAITTLYNTGVDASGVVLPDGTVGDPHYTLITVPGGTTATRIITSASGFPIPPYIGDNAFSRWIGPNSSGGDLDGPAGTYVFRTTFDLTGFDFTTANIAGGWSTDNNGLDILINGTSLGYTTGFEQFRAGFSAFAVTSGFVAGINTLDFVVNNGGGPIALRVEMAGTVPEPGSLALAALALAGLGAVARRRQR